VRSLSGISRARTQRPGAAAAAADSVDRGCSGRREFKLAAVTMRWAWLLPPQVRVIMAVRSRASAPPEPAGSATSRRLRYRPARYMKGPPQVNRRSVKGQPKLARQRLTGSRFIHGRPLHSAGRAGHAGAACCPGVAAHMKRHVSRHGSAPVHGDTAVPAGSSRRPQIARRADHAGQTAGPPAIFWGWRGQWAIEIQEGSGPANRCLRFLARSIRLRDRVHDRGRCPLYVRAQLDSVGLSWTQRDLVRLKATAREAG
jgi:hypothetical protein